MRPPFRSSQAVIINAPLEAVWAFSMDITKIPEFHPRVVKVELLSGKALREPGVSYQCHLSGGKHTCVEKDIEIVPMQKIVPTLKAKLLNLIAKRRIARDTQATLNASKAAIETAQAERRL